MLGNNLEWKLEIVTGRKSVLDLINQIWQPFVGADPGFLDGWGDLRGGGGQPIIQPIFFQKLHEDEGGVLKICPFFFLWSCIEYPKFPIYFDEKQSQLILKETTWSGEKNIFECVEKNHYYRCFLSLDMYWTS